jgi:hypothetical protein
MTGSDEDAEGHNVWVEKLQARGTILISINEQDGTLARSKHPDGKNPLGMGAPSPLANNAAYLDTTGLVGKTHRLFAKGKQHKRVAICQVFTAMLRGEKPDLSGGPSLKEVKRERVFVPVSTVGGGDACFQGVADSPDVDDDEG